MPLTQDLLRLRDYRSANPQLTDLSDDQLADLVNRQTGELSDLKSSSAIGRTIARGANLFNAAGEKTEELVKRVAGTSYPARIGARAANMAVASSPEYLLNVLAARVAPQSTMGLVGLGAMNTGLAAARTFTETGDKSAAAGSGAGAAASLIGALAGAKVGSRFGRVGGMTGAFLGGQPGTALEIATSPGGIEEFIKDPVNIPAVVLSQLPYMAIDSATEAGKAAKQRRDKQIAETPSLDDISNLSEAQELIKLNKIPVAELTEQAQARIRELERSLARQEELKLYQSQKNEAKLIPDLSSNPETPATILEQIRMMNRGKKPAVFIPSSTKVPTVPFEMQGYMSFDTPEGYWMYNPKLTNEKAIRDSIAQKKIGQILGYGTDDLPADPNGYAYVLRNRKGVEKMAVGVGISNEAQVAAKLKSLAEPGDYVRRESLMDVIDARASQRNLVKQYSVVGQPEALVADQNVSLSRLYTDYFLDRTEANDASEVRLPHWLSSVGGRETLINPPPDFVNYLRRRKVLLRKAPMPQERQAEFQWAVDARNFFQNTLLKNFERALTPTDKKGARFQLDADGNIGADGALKAIEQWTTKEMLEHYKAAGLEEFLKPKGKHYQYTYQAPQKLGERTIPGFVQIDEFEGAKNIRSSNLEKLRAEGINLPDIPADLEQGQYRLVNGKLVKGGTLSNFNKVNFKALSDWIQDNTPQIEIKKLKVRDPQAESEAQQRVIQAERDFNAAQHQVETLGFKPIVDETAGYRYMGLRKNGKDYVEQGGYVYEYEEGPGVKSITHKLSDLPKEVQNYFNKKAEYEQWGTREPDQLSDAATGRYGVEPIEVGEMDDPVDILVRVPRRELTPEQTGNTGLRMEDPLYRGPHFGASDVNVIASIRGYFKTLADGSRAFFPFEVQSDWGQSVSKELQRLSESLAEDFNIHEKRKFSEVGHKDSAWQSWLKRKYPELVNEIVDRKNVKHQKVFKEFRADFHHEKQPTSHPLLASYETLAIKAAIQHALENGATKIVFPDSKTAMMIEGHDKYRQAGHMRIDHPNTDGSGNRQYKVTNTRSGQYRMFDSYDQARDYADAQGEISQEAGMVQHYDRNIPAIISRLTGDKGTLVDLGKFTTRKRSEYFNRDNIIGRVYDLSNLKPEVQNLFSLYGQNEQHDFAQSLKQLDTELEKQLAAGADVTSEQFVDAITRGENVDKAIILKYLKGLSGNPEEFRAFLADPVNGMFARGFTSGTKVNINLKQSNADAFATFGHEASHVVANILRFANPEAYADFIAFPTKFMTGEQRKSVLQELYKSAGVEAPDLDYLAGLRFKPDDPDLQTKQAYEFYGALSEVLAHQVFRDAGINPTIAKWFSWLPMGAQRWLSNLAAQFTKFFGPQYPSLRHMLDEQSMKLTSDAYAKLVKFTHSNEAAQGQAIRQLKKLGLYDEAAFLDKIPTGNAEQIRDAIRSVSSMPDDLRHYALDYIKATRFAQGINNAYEDNFMSPLFRTKIYPETTDFFRELHHFRNKIKTYEHGYISFLGQDKNNTLTQEQALKNFDDYIQRLVSPYDKGRNARLEAMSKVIQRNQDIREGLINPKDPNQAPVGFVTADKLVTRDQMIKEFGLSPTDADFLERLVHLPRLVAEQTLRFMQATDSVNLSKLFYLQNKAQDINKVKAKVAELTRLSNDAGSNALERSIYERYYERLQQDPNSSPERKAELESRIFTLKQKDDVFRQLMDQQIRTLFAGDILFQPKDDAFISKITSVATRLAMARAEQAFIMRDEGYAPMTRRGRFLVQTFKQSFDGTVMPGTTESLRGFKTKQEADAYRKVNGLDDTNSKLMDKDTFAARAQLYTTRQLQAVRDKARADFDTLLHEYSRQLPESLPNRDQILSALSDIRNQFRPLDQEIKEVISAKGDKFKERRWNVPGFNELDFIPNIFEYTNYKTVVGQKALTRAEAELQMLRKSVQENPTMLNRMNRELDYVLGHSSEAAGLRKLVFYNYLGASVRHMIQNLLQVPLNGIPEMMTQGAGFHSYSHAIKAAKLAAQYAKDGTTGNKVFDVLLKQAEKEGVTIPNAIEFFAPESSELQVALDTIAAQTSGVKEFGQKANYTGSQFFKGFEKFMRSTAVASEQANRRVSFLMSLLESERRGITDPRVMFNNANVFTDYVNFVGDKSNRPGFQVKLGNSWAHAPVLVATALQSFVLNHISQLYAYGRLAMRGDVNYQKAFVTGTVHLLAMAGAMGLPLAQSSEQLFETVTGISLKEALRRKLIVGAQDMFDMDATNGGRVADAVLHGFPKLLGVEASQSIGLGDPLFRVEAGKEPSLFDLAGPTGGVAEKVWEGQKALRADVWDPDSWFKATRIVAPQALNYWFKLADATMKGGFYDRGGAPVVDNLDGKSSVSLLAGFTPTQVADTRKVQTLRAKTNQKMDEDYKNAVDQIAKALYDYEQSGDFQYANEASERFSKYVDSVAGTQDRSVLVKSINNRLQQFRSPSNEPPSVKEAQPMSEILASYPEAEYPYRERLPGLLSELTVAQLLGQDDVLAQRVRSLKTSLLQSALYDSLVQSGFSPSEASMVAQGGKTLVQKRRLLSPFQSTSSQ
jgi:Fe-S cluster biosynthesis and repair protein YggX